ncbi:hypothetical protein EV207_102186 [Scopulibacillus darangshiensis]|uniref:Uncharacterized protein n=1 Tax=Scopulibacillus darangshiensis TaxID=442528 RepID=A0A4R2PCP8_9BACL|nr:hypothetical protein [Scopulibacillus darangshiensis]TCP31695.1 hypothetical protein EV207_102186 [Scopulibacillus darangshiensis]
MMTLATFWDQCKDGFNGMKEKLPDFIRLYKLRTLLFILFTPVFTAIPMFFFYAMFHSTVGYGILYFLILVITAMPWVVLPVIFLYSIDEINRSIQYIWSAIILFSCLFWFILFLNLNF